MVCVFFPLSLRRWNWSRGNRDYDWNNSIQFRVEIASVAVLMGINVCITACIIVYICWLIWTIQKSLAKLYATDQISGAYPIEPFHMAIMCHWIHLTIIMCIYLEVNSPVDRFIRLIISLIPMYYTFNISPEELVYFAYSIENSILSYRFNSPCEYTEMTHFAYLFRCHFKQFVFDLNFELNVLRIKRFHLFCDFGERTPSIRTLSIDFRTTANNGAESQECATQKIEHRFQCQWLGTFTFFPDLISNFRLDEWIFHWRQLLKMVWNDFPCSILPIIKYNYQITCFRVILMFKCFIPLHRNFQLFMDLSVFEWLQ